MQLQYQCCPLSVTVITILIRAAVVINKRPSWWVCWYLSCAGLNENGPYRLMYLDVWSLVGVMIWEGSGDVVILEEVWHWGCAFTFLVSFSLPHACGSGCEFSTTIPLPCLLASCHVPWHDDYGLTLWKIETTTQSSKLMMFHSRLS